MLSIDAEMPSEEYAIRRVIGSKSLHLMNEIAMENMRKGFNFTAAEDDVCIALYGMLG